MLVRCLIEVMLGLVEGQLEIFLGALGVVGHILQEIARVQRSGGKLFVMRVES